MSYHVCRPATHKGWLDERKKGVGASSAGAVMGVSAYNTRYSLWRQMVGIDPPTEENWSMRIGHIFEIVVSEMFEDEIGLPIQKNSVGDWIAISDESPILRVSPDRIYGRGKQKGVLEIKSSRNDYHPECLDDSHLDWFCQIQYQMHVLGMKEGYLGFVNTENSNHWFRKVDYDESFCKMLVSNITSFWNDNVYPAMCMITDNGWSYPLDSDKVSMLEQYAPPITTPSDIEKKYTKHISGKTLEATPELLELLSEYSLLKKSVSEYSNRMEVIKDNIKSCMVDAEYIIQEGKPVVSWRSSSPSLKFDEKRFKEENPTSYANYTIEKENPRRFIIK